MSCGRIRKDIGNGWTTLVDGELKNLKTGVLCLETGQSFHLNTLDREYACVLISGECEMVTKSGMKAVLGPRRNPFEDAPYGALFSRDEEITFSARGKVMMGIGSSPAPMKTGSVVITPDKVGGGPRGKGNWEREVRFVLWSDNTEGNMLIAGETCTPPGNWSSIPPHRHQYDIPGKEVPYEETYFFQFSRKQGFGIGWQFDDEGSMDQAFSLRENDVIYMDAGYHSVVSGPGAALYHLTFLCGPNRISRASVHGDFQFLLDENHMESPYAKQFVQK